MSTLVDDLRSFKESPTMQAEEMAKYIALRLKLDPDAFSADEAVEEKPKRRGRKPKSEDASQEEKEKTPEKTEPSRPEMPKAPADSQPSKA